MKVIQKHFSLVEIFIAMVILLVIMLCMVMMLNSTQTVVLGSVNQDSLFSDTHVAFDLMTRDLQASLYEEDKIFFWQKSDSEINFVTVSVHVEPTEASNVIEVKYKLDSSDGFIKRSIFNIGNSEWNFYGNKSISAWDEEDFQEIMPYVTDLKFTCFDKDGNIISPSTTELTPYPNSVQIDIAALGGRSYLKWKETGDNQHRIDNERTFTKRIFLGDR